MIAFGGTHTHTLVAMLLFRHIENGGREKVKRAREKRKHYSLPYFLIPAQQQQQQQ